MPATSLTVETLSLKRLYLLFFISLERRRIEYVAVTSNPDGKWIAQQTRNLRMALDDRQRSFRFLIHDRDSKFSSCVDAIFGWKGSRSSGRRCRRPMRTRKRNAGCEPSGASASIARSSSAASAKCSTRSRISRSLSRACSIRTRPPEGTPTPARP